MSTPQSFNNDSASDKIGAERIEPVIGEGKPAPWDLAPDAKPAFEMIEDPKDDWIGANERTSESKEECQTEPRLEPDVSDTFEANPTTSEKAPHCHSEPVLAPEAETVPTFAERLPSDNNESRKAVADSEQASKPVSPVEPEIFEQRPSSEPAPKEKATLKPGFFAFMKKGSENHQTRLERSVNTAGEVSEEELLAREKTRNRLIGAAAVLMAVVVSSSFVLDNEKLVESDVIVSTDIPAVPDKATATLDPALIKATEEKVKAKKPEAPAATSLSKTEPKPTAVKTPEKVRPKDDTMETAKTSSKAERPADKTAKPASHPAKVQGYFVQIVVTSSEQKATKMVRDLKRLKLPAYSEEIRGKKGPLWRVRIGHYKTEKEAKSVVAVLALNGYTGKHYIDRQ